MSAKDALAVIREGGGPEVHGGASPETTWGALAPLRARWTLARVHRRGYPPSPPPPEGRQDFEVDAADLAPLLAARPHVVAHSYGVLGTLLAATRAPARVRSLTLIEPPLYHVVPGDPEVARLERIGNAGLTDGLEADAATLRESFVWRERPAWMTGRFPTTWPALERICDALSTALDARRLVAPGAGHFVAAAPGFVDRLDEFLASAA